MDHADHRFGEAASASGPVPAEGRGGGDGARRAALLLVGVLVGVLIAALAACGTSPPLRYYTIEPVAPAPLAASPGAAYRGSAIAVGAVQVPPAMDRLEMLRDVEAGRVEIRELDHWAAPLARSARLALAQDLAARLPAGMLRFGGSGGGAAALLRVEVLSFRLGDGAASMTATWSVEPAPGSAAAADDRRGGAAASPRPDATSAMRGDSTVEAPAGADALATARAWSTLLALLADDIVARVSQASAGAAPPETAGLAQRPREGAARAATATATP